MLPTSSSEEYVDSDVRQYFADNPDAGRDLIVARGQDGRIFSLEPMQFVFFFGPSVDTARVMHQANEEGVKAVDANNWSLLHMAVRKGFATELIHFLVDAYPGALRIVTREGWTVAQLACQFDAHIDVIKKVAEGATDMLVHKSGKGNTPLHAVIACPQDCEAKYELVKLIVDLNPSAVLINTKRGTTPMKMAKSYRCSRPIRDKIELTYAVLTMRDRTFDTWFELERAITQLEEYVGEDPDVSAENDPHVIERARLAGSVLKDLYAKREELFSPEDLDHQIELADERVQDSLNIGEYEIAKEHRQEVERLEALKDTKADTPPGKASKNDHTEESSIRVSNGLKYGGTWEAVPLALPFLMSSTDKFNPKERIGRGGFADVYRGIDTWRGSCFAVKRLDDTKLRGKGGKELMNKMVAEIEVNTNKPQYVCVVFSCSPPVVFPRACLNYIIPT